MVQYESKGRTRYVLLEKSELFVTVLILLSVFTLSIFCPIEFTKSQEPSVLIMKLFLYCLPLLYLGLLSKELSEVVIIKDKGFYPDKERMGKSYIYTYLCSSEFDISNRITLFVYIFLVGVYLSDIRWLEFLGFPIFSEIIITIILGILILIAFEKLREIVYLKLF